MARQTKQMLLEDVAHLTKKLLLATRIQEDHYKELKCIVEEKVKMQEELNLHRDEVVQRRTESELLRNMLDAEGAWIAFQSKVCQCIYCEAIFKGTEKQARIHAKHCLLHPIRDREKVYTHEYKVAMTEVEPTDPPQKEAEWQHAQDSLASYTALRNKVKKKEE